jgi:hypothetical protein
MDRYLTPGKRYDKSLWKPCSLNLWQYLMEAGQASQERITVHKAKWLLSWTIAPMAAPLAARSHPGHHQSKGTQINREINGEQQNIGNILATQLSTVIVVESPPEYRIAYSRSLCRSNASPSLREALVTPKRKGSCGRP